MQTPTNDTKERILDAVERLFAEKGLEGVSLRAVTTEAGVNLAAVNYHFGSKEALLASMVGRFLDTVNAEREHLLDELEAKASVPAVEDLLVSFASPIFTLFDQHHGRDWGQVWMIATRTADRSGQTMLRGMDQIRTDQMPGAMRRYYEALQRSLPHLHAEELWWRFERANNLLMANQGKHLMAASESRTYSKSPDERAWLITFLAGALQAPATSPKG